MIIIRNKLIPFPGYKAMAILPFIFTRVKVLRDNVISHERIHLRQQLEMLIVGIIISGILALTGCSWWSLLAVPLFFWWYIVEYLIRFAVYRNNNKAYRNVAFEREAYTNEEDIMYLERRRLFAWMKYI